MKTCLNEREVARVVLLGTPPLTHKIQSPVKQKGDIRQQQNHLQAMPHLYKTAHQI